MKVTKANDRLAKCIPRDLKTFPCHCSSTWYIYPSKHYCDYDGLLRTESLRSSALRKQFGEPSLIKAWQFSNNFATFHSVYIVYADKTLSHISVTVLKIHRRCHYVKHVCTSVTLLKLLRLCWELLSRPTSHTSVIKSNIYVCWLRF